MSAEKILKDLLDSLPPEHHERAGIMRSIELLRSDSPEPKQMFMVAALYETPFADDKLTVCLGLRVGDSEGLPRLMKLLIKQVRERYPAIFKGMKPKEIESACRWSIYDLEPDRNGFPQFLGGAWWR